MAINIETNKITVWLKEYLLANGRMVPVDQIKAEAIKQKYNWNSVLLYRKLLSIRTHREGWGGNGGRWLWEYCGTQGKATSKGSKGEDGEDSGILVGPIFPNRC